MGKFQKRKRISESDVASNADVNVDSHADSHADTYGSRDESQQNFSAPRTGTGSWAQGPRHRNRQGPQYRRQLSGRHRPPSEGGKTPKLLRLPSDVVWMLDQLKAFMRAPYNDIASEAIRDLWHKRYAGVYRDILPPQQGQQGY